MRRASVFLAALAVATAVACRSAPDTKPPAGGAAISGVARAKPRTGVDAMRGYYTGGAGHERVDYGKLAGIVVWVDGDDGAPAPSRVVATTLKAEGFEPDVVALGTADVLEVKNDTREPATVYGEGSIDETTIAPGATARVRAKRAGAVLVVCEELDAPKLHAISVASRHVAVVKSGEGFGFALARPGDYVVRAWHWRLPPFEKSVRAELGKTQEIELVLSVNALGGK